MTDAARNGFGKFARKPFCIVCNKPRGDYNTGKNGRAVCSNICDKAYKQKLIDAGRVKSQYIRRPLRKSYCAYCGEIFTTSRPHKLFCSTRCKKIYRHRILGIKKKYYYYTPVIRQTRPCEHCGKDFTSIARAKYCSPKCWGVANRKTHRRNFRQRNRLAAGIMRQLVGTEMANKLIKQVFNSRPAKIRHRVYDSTERNRVAVALLKQLIGKETTHDVLRHLVKSY